MTFSKNVLFITVLVVCYFLIFSPDVLSQTVTSLTNQSPHIVKSCPLSKESFNGRPVTNPSCETISEIDTKNHFANHKNAYENKLDFAFSESLASVLKSLSACGSSSKHAVIMGGLNEGQLAHHLLDSCKGLHFVGLEIQEKMFQKARLSLPNTTFVNTVLIHAGMSDEEREVSFLGEDEGSSIIEGEELNRLKDWKKSSYKVKVLPLTKLAHQYVFDKGLSLFYTSIDTEGHEPLVIKGMHLENECNRMIFSAFQYEIGGTWAERDDRHPKGSFSEFEMATYLHDFGYELYMIGTNLLRVEPNFFQHPTDDEGYGPFVPGNVLVVHRLYADVKLLELIDSVAMTFCKN
jgi:FkbM family methyltransferase